MTQNTAIRPGFAWAADIQFEGEVFPVNATFRAQFRATRDGPVLVDVTTGIIRTAADEIRVQLSALQTADITDPMVFFDVVRTDGAAPDLLSAEFEVDVKRSITRL